MSNVSLERALHRQLAEIDKQAEEIKRYIKQTHFLDTDIYSARNRDGSFVMMPLITARANVLLALAILKEKK